MASSAHAGIAHQPLGNAAIEYLPLEHVSVTASVVDVSARIVLAQTFHNPANTPTGRAKYVFPLPATAAVCAFRLELEDGSVVVGEIKEREEAEHTFTAALSQGQTAALVERVTDDIFTISIGSVPAATRVTAHLTFVMDLLDEGARDHVRLQLPMHIAQRYGTPPAALHDASAADAHTRVRISVDVQTTGEIYKIDGSTRAIERWRYEVHSGQEKQRHMSASWESSGFLENDFIITIHAEGLDKPRCFAEVFNEGHDDSTIAMQLTLVPKFLAPKVSSQEYIFVIDRSGSMQGDSMETAKLTLSVLLRLLPSTQTTFNIFSFGTTVSALWQTSRGLDQASLVEATSHVDSMNANLGGTEILRALEVAFNSRGRDRPAAVFLLTDGRIHDNDQLNGSILNAVRDSLPEAPVRLFVLGIGTGVSSDVCSRLARQGDGEYLFAASAEHIQGKCARLLNAAFSKNIERIDANWGLSPSGLPPSVTTPNCPNLPANLPTLAPPPPVQQAPHALTEISSGIRFTVFAIVSSTTVPTSVKLTTLVQDDAQPKEWDVAVTRVNMFPNDVSDVRMVHTLAARKLIMALNDGVGPLPAPASGDILEVSEKDLCKAGIMRLGLTYRLMSKHTSFVAVRKDDDKHVQKKGRRSRSSSWTRIDKEDADDEHPTAAAPTFLDTLIDDAEPSASPSQGSSHDSTSTPANADPIARAPSPVFEVIEKPAVHRRPRRQGRPCGAALCEVSSLPSAGTAKLHSLKQTVTNERTASGVTSPIRSRRSQPRIPASLTMDLASVSMAMPPSMDPMPVMVTKMTPTPQMTGPGLLASPPSASSSSSSSSSASVSARTDSMHALALEMAIDGSFAATPLLTALVGAAVLSSASVPGVDVRVWTTAVAVAYLRRHLNESAPELMVLVVDKARAFAEAAGVEAGRFDELVREATAALAQV